MIGYLGSWTDERYIKMRHHHVWKPRHDLFIGPWVIVTQYVTGVNGGYQCQRWARCVGIASGQPVMRVGPRLVEVDG